MHLKMFFSNSIFLGSIPPSETAPTKGLPRDVKPTAEYRPWQEVASHPGHAFRARVGAKCVRFIATV